MVEAQFKAAVVASPRDVGEAEGRGEAYLTQDEFQAPYAHLHRVRCVYTAHRRLTTLSPLHVHVHYMCMYAAHALYCTTGLLHAYHELYCTHHTLNYTLRMHGRPSA